MGAVITLGLGTESILIAVRESRPSGPRRLDVPGAVVFTIGLVALICGLIESGTDGCGSPEVLVALAVVVDDSKLVGAVLGLECDKSSLVRRSDWGGGS